jgi:predicted PurR-regulated permease PerM
MPILLIFLGVLGGALTFGFIGVFIGPTLLAVGYRLVEEWAATHPATAIGDVPSPSHEDTSKGDTSWRGTTSST